MSDEAIDKLKGEILRDPAVILDDPDVMRALLSSQEDAAGDNVVDLRAIFMTRLEDRLDRLEETHKTVIAAAYENLAGTNQIHRSILSLLEADDFNGFLAALEHDIANILAVDVIRLCLETEKAEGGEAIGPEGPLKNLVIALPRYGVAAYINGGQNKPAPQVTTRPASDVKDAVFGDAAVDVHSEALLRLDLGNEKLPGMVAFGSSDPHRFSTDQGADLLSFFGHAIERIMRHWAA